MAATVTDTQGIIAIAAAAAAVLALIGCLALSLRVRRLRRAQRLVLGEAGERDLVAHVAGMQGAFEGMWDGTVDLNWAKEHHNLWLNEEERKGEIADDQRRAAAAAAE